MYVLRFEGAESTLSGQQVRAEKRVIVGRFDECGRLAAEAARGLRDHDGRGKAAAELFESMAHHRLGRHEKAERLLDETARWVRKTHPKAGVAELGGAIESWLILHVPCVMRKL